MKTEVNSFLSSDGKHRLPTVTWLPETGVKPKAILQIVYGMAEYAQRYEPVAEYFTSQGFIVATHDHLGHGGAVRSDKEYGYFGPKGAEHLIADTYARTQQLQDHYPNTPIYLLGHSMGSIIAALYMAQHWYAVHGLILMGSVYLPPILPPLMPLIRLKARITGRQPDRLLNAAAFGPYSRRFDHHDFFSWLSSDADSVARYEADPKLGFTFTTNGFLTLFTLLTDQEKMQWYRQLPKDFPILVTSGQLDAVGDFGKEPKTIAENLTHDGFVNVLEKQWPDLRHELFFEKDKPAVEAYLANWMLANLGNHPL
ncbi:hypothetical protein FC83_GL003172 [Agrilactobacillus composti DSM 18527 = JCM 14202]|uniref:Serine aminopeptidase S33 domain-containing protein n=1 Tax=Agrilactobacillus composti DSM 18527 = JCM 14202 TaxID=1423734 RepID=X0QIY5_9LACO|nr:alpha/beta hydrolase [Agrilactobacillus composti]KRM33091.1 hypothetical protein FC83_GL003172 [Agrilactobacillus composti DSM 18527 = JCM 14202]GAF38555.1 lysophospholipase [Agrilactobacillus composti DSM 18527 = JCM 14202]